MRCVLLRAALLLNALLQPCQTVLLQRALRLHPSSCRTAACRSAVFVVLSEPASTGATGGLPEGRVHRRVIPPMPGARGWPGGLPDADGLAGGFVFGEASVVRALNELRKGSLVLLAEDGDKSSKFSLVVSPELVTTEQIDFLNQHAVRTQVALLPAAYQRVYESLHKIVLDNNNLARPALSVSVHGSGRSPLNSSHVASTVRALLHLNATAKLSCPGAVALSCSREGGVLRRAGATEAAVELCRLAGLPPVAMYAVANISGQSELRAFAEKWGLVYSSTADLIAFQRRRSALVERCAPPVAMPTKFGVFTAHCYRSLVDGVEHIALVKAQSGDELPHKLKPFLGSTKPALVRVHSECCTGDIFGSLRCDCGPQLEAGLRAIERDGWGVFLYLRGQEGRGIGLGAKIHAYSLQERGLDTLDANTELGLPVDSREYGTGAQILVDLGIRDMRLISNNPKKFTGLAGFGLRIVDREPSHTAPNKENIGYLRTKVERMGHMLELGDSSDWAENGTPPPVSGGSQTSAASQDEE